MHQTKLHKTFLILILLITVSAFPSFGQKLEVYSGANYNHFYDFEKDYPGHGTDYSGSFGFTFGCAIDSLAPKGLTLRMSLQYDLYSGSFDSYYGQHGGHMSANGEIQKGILSLSVYPINLRKIAPQFQISIGAIASVLIHESISGRWGDYSSGIGGGSGNLDEKSETYSKYVTFGVQALFNYRIPISNTLELVPQYLFYLGLSNEVNHIPQSMKSMRHYFLIGIQKRIK